MIVRVGSKRSTFDDLVTIYVEGVEYQITADRIRSGIWVQVLGQILTEWHDSTSVTVYDKHGTEGPKE